MNLHGSDPLWVCHTCHLIGGEDEARSHATVRGHIVEELSQDVSDGIREEWREEQARRVAGLLGYARIVGRSR